MKVEVYIILALVPCTIYVEGFAREDIISRCMDAKREDIEPCIMEIFSDLQPQYEAGIPEFGLPPMAAVPFDKFTVTEYQNENSYFNLEMRDIIGEGLDESQMATLQVDYDNKLIHSQILLPETLVKSKYTLNAKLTLIPLEGEGTLWAKLKTGHAVVECTFDLIGDDPHLKLECKVPELQFQDVTIRLNNLFKDNPILKEAAESFVNQSGPDLLAIIIPELEKRFGEVITSYGNNILETLSFTELAGQEYLKKAFNI